MVIVIELGERILGNFVRFNIIIWWWNEQKPLTAKDRAYGPNSTLNKDKARQQGKMSDLRGGGGNTGKSPISNVSDAISRSINHPLQEQSYCSTKASLKDASYHEVNTPEKMKVARVGSALRAQQDKQAAAKAAANAPRPMARPGARNADPTPVAKPAAAAPALTLLLNLLLLDLLLLVPLVLLLLLLLRRNLQWVLATE